MIQLGYACINTQLNKKFQVNSTCRQKTFEDKGLDFVIQKVRNNLNSVLKNLEWNENNNIKLYRLSSTMFPHITNPKFMKSETEYSYSLELFKTELKNIGAFAKKHNHRITFHPDHFNQIGSPHDKVFIKTLNDLSYHADVLDLCGLDKNSIMVVHVGGRYDSKEKTIQRWIKNFYRLPKKVQDRIVIENCENSYCYKDVLKICKIIKRPFIFDTHHHDCYSLKVKKLKDPSEFIHKIIKTWTILGIKPKFHVSEQDPDKRVGAHSILVENIPQYLLDIDIDIDIMIEAKGKEQAVLKLMHKYNYLF